MISRYFTAIFNAVCGFDFYSDRVVNSLKTATACLLGLAIVRFFHLPSGQWMLITIIVIMSGQIRLGGALQRSYTRALGTAAGAGIAVLTLALFGNHLLTSSIAIFFSALLFSYIATSPSFISNAGAIGAATVVLVLAAPNPSFIYGLERILEILAGIMVALLVSVGIFPIYARKTLLHNFATGCKKLTQFYQLSLCQASATEDEIQTLEEEIIKAFTTQRQLIKESATELRQSKHKTKTFDQIIHCEREIFHAILLMRDSLQASTTATTVIQPIEALHLFHQDVIQQLEQLGELFKQKKAAPDLLALQASLNQVESAIQAVSLQHTLQTLVNVHSYLFCAKLIVKKLQEFSLLALAVTEHRNQTNGRDNDQNHGIANES